MRLTVDEYAKNFKMSREMINSKLRAKKLNYIIENGCTYIIVEDGSTNNTIDTPPQIKKTKAVSKPKTTVAMVLSLYQRENQQLKEKIVQLEEKIDKLIDDKEQMLRDEMEKIEQVYSAKDEQLKNILELLGSKLMLENQTQTVHEVETISQDEIEDAKEHKKEKKDKLVELGEYIKSLGIKSYQRKIIKKRFLAVHDSDIRIILQNGKMYLDFSKYDYSDLLEY
jgi:hypothetical protein